MRNIEIGWTSSNRSTLPQDGGLPERGDNGHVLFTALLVFVAALAHAQQAAQSLLPHAVAQQLVAIAPEPVGYHLHLLLGQAHLYMSHGREHDHRSNDRREQTVDLIVMKH